MATALITGASAGLGEQFAHLFAKDGHDVVLVARNEARLVAIAERLRIHKVKVHVVPEDLSRPGCAARLYERVKAMGVQVDFLVNNAGFGSTGPFLDLPLEREVEMVELNCVTLMELCHRFGRELRDRKSGKILNIASTAGFQPGPFMSTYYATKAFVVSFSEGLAHELKDSGVTVTCYCPGATHTEFAKTSGNDKSRLFQRPGVAKAEDVAADAYRAMVEGEVLAVHGLMNFLGMQGLRLSPRAVIRSITAAVNLPPES
ncbi:MAG: SDR family oxidoreductase [Myxococcaceae bacterium]